jgi:predicted 3-demethylubiquinone-9 3-methyltransferase (glyoxalase superfamily)
MSIWRALLRRDSKPESPFGPIREAYKERYIPMTKITPFLWFDTQAEEAARFYVSVFPNSKIVKIARYGEAGPGPAGSVMTVAFELDGQPFIALNGGPHYKFTEAISFSVNCKTQSEVDEYWTKLSEGGEEGPCGWLKDKFGLSWQVNPTILGEMLSDPDPEKAKLVMGAMLKMKKIDIAELKKAYTQG